MRTKIVCTIGPSSEAPDTLRGMIRAGMDVARLNFSHGTHADHARRLAAIRAAAESEAAPITIMGDLQGPKFRLGKLPEHGVQLEPGQRVVLCASEAAANLRSLTTLPMPHPEVIGAMRAAQRVLIDDGTFELCVVEKPAPDTAVCEVKNGGVITSRKGVSLPGATIPVSSITPKDRDDLAFAIAHGLDAVALSFVRRGEDIVELRQLIRALCPDPDRQPHIVAKIEKPEAVENLGGILTHTDAVMVARGDLGVEASPEDVPFYQKHIIRACLQVGTPVITATQMLQSMISAPVPTRAEASDVANAVLDGTDAVMTSAETATGQFPVETVRVMQTICSRAEADETMWSDVEIDWSRHADAMMHGPDDVTDAITHAAVNIATQVGATAIVCLTNSGRTARMVARHRPQSPIVALTTNPRTLKFTAFMWDVRGYAIELVLDVDTMLDSAAKLLRERGVVQAGQRVVVIAGVPLGHGTGTTNLIKVQVV